MSNVTTLFYHLFSLLFFQGKIDTNAEVGLSFQQVVTPGVTLTLSTLIQSKNFHAGGHKVGVGIELNP